MLGLAVFFLLEWVPTQAGLAGSSCGEARVAFGARDYERAVGLARACIEGGAASAETYKLFALSSYLLGRADDYRAAMNKALELDPADSDAYYHLGRFYFEKKQYADALERFRRSVELDPQSYRAYYYSGLCRQAGDATGAIEDWRKAIAIIDKRKVAYGWPFVELGDQLVIDGDYEGGLAWIYRGVRNDPNLPYTHYGYARALMRKEPSFEVEQALQRALRLDPNYPDALYLLGRYYSKIGDKDRAQQAFARFEELRKNPVPSLHGVRRQF